MLTRDQYYGAKIFRQISDLKKTSQLEGKEGKTYADSYGSMAHKLPVLIRSAGLAQALAFVQARGREPHHKLLDHLAKVVLTDQANGEQLARASRETEQLSEYMYLTHEALAALVWYKRFAQSVLDVDASEASTEEIGPE
jgi:CRISPR-associated protein Cmr5